MEITLQKGKLDAKFFSKIKSEVKILANISYILDKIDKDGYLKIIKSTFIRIMQNEIVYAIKELEKKEK